MAKGDLRESSRDGEDAPTTVRALSSLDGALMHVDLAAASEQLRQEESWTTSGRNAMTLVKYRELRVVLEVMRPGSRIEDPRPETGRPVVIQLLAGHLRLDVAGQAVDLGPGQLVALDHMMPAAITALEESSFLIWVAWSE